MTSMKHTYALVLAGVLATAPAAYAQDRQTHQAVPRSEPAPPPPPPPAQAAPAPPPSRAEAPPPRAVDRSAPERAAPRTAPAHRGDDRSATRGVMRTPSAAADDGQGRPRTAHGGNGGSARGGTPRSGSGGGTTARAVPRSDSGRDGDGTVATSPRSRGDRQSYGVATSRRFPYRPPHGGGGYYPWSDPWWWNSYPYSFGFFAWDPFWYGASYPAYGGGYGYGSGYGYDPGYGYGSSGYGLYGALKLKVKPRDAEVFVDGYFVGRVDDFDGLFQKLSLESGPHRIEIRAPGYETLSIDVRIEFDETTTYRGDLQPIH